MQSVSSSLIEAVTISYDPAGRRALGHLAGDEAVDRLSFGASRPEDDFYQHTGTAQSKLKSAYRGEQTREVMGGRDSCIFLDISYMIA